MTGAPAPTERDVAAARLMFETLRTANALIAAGDALMSPLGLTSARWQVLGTLAFLDQPQTVSALARRLSLSRQAVQRVADDMERAGLLAFADNPAHQRARLVVLTAEGSALQARVEAIRLPWTEGLADALADLPLTEAEAVLRTLRNALASGGPG